jgi:hypothetical protein
MPQVEWPLMHGRPCIKIVLTQISDSLPTQRTLLADTGAGSKNSGIDLILDENDCLLCGGLAGASVKLKGAFIGSFPLYDLFVQIPALSFAQNLRVAGVSSLPPTFEGIACFGFLNVFRYGNSGDSNKFGLER